MINTRRSHPRPLDFAPFPARAGHGGAGVVQANPQHVAPPLLDQAPALTTQRVARDLSSALAEADAPEVGLAGDYIVLSAVVTSTGLPASDVAVGLKFNDPGNAFIPSLPVPSIVRTRFARLWASWPAQADRTLYICAGAGAIDAR